MADKIPLKAIYSGADPTALGEFAAEETVPLTNGGTGATTASTARTNLGLGSAATSATSDFAPATGSTVYAPLASPALTGNPTAPTATQGDNDTTIATTAFVNAEIAADLAQAITGATDIGADLVDADSVLVYDASATANRKSLLSRVWTYIKAKIGAESQVAFADGSSTAPSIANSDDLNTGIFFPAADTVAISTGGSTRLKLSPDNVEMSLFAGATQGRYLNFRPELPAGSEYNISLCAYDHTGDSNADGLSINGNDGVSICAGSNTRLERLRVTTGGNLLIGTTTDDATGAKLQVNGGITLVPGASVTPTLTGSLAFQLTNNTTLTLKAKGSDGTVRSVALTLA